MFNSGILTITLLNTSLNNTILKLEKYLIK